VITPVIIVLVFPPLLEADAKARLYSGLKRLLPLININTRMVFYHIIGESGEEGAIFGEIPV
jgi:hypothetical protein